MKRPLSRRELQIMEQILKGNDSAKGLAAHFGTQARALSVRTIHAQLATIRLKLDVRTTTQAALVYSKMKENGLL